VVDDIRLTKDEQIAFVAALLNPPAISERLRQALEEHALRVDMGI